jgi:hypothetical protein
MRKKGWVHATDVKLMNSERLNFFSLSQLLLECTIVAIFNSGAEYPVVVAMWQISCHLLSHI